MQLIVQVFKGYQKVERHIWYVIAAMFCIQIVNAAFFLLLNYYMVNEGYEYLEVAEVLSYRFLSVALFAFPFGLFIKGRRLKPFFWLCSLTFPICSFLVIYAVQLHQVSFLYGVAMLWGLSFICLDITILPYIVLNARKETHSESISMKFLTFSLSLTSVGLLNYLLHAFDPELFDEKMVLQLIAGMSGLSIFFVSKIHFKEKISERVPFRMVAENYDWHLIFRAIIPTLIIAIGAGFTIPVINLFFLKVHGLSSEYFSILGSITFGLVIFTMIMMPYIRRKFGYRIAIIYFQSAAVLALFLLATTEYYNDYSFALYVAAFFYIIRQPLMNAAQPMSSELTMYYVGKRNQEIMSALNSTIWSGSFFFSTKAFAYLRLMELRYVSIFLITVVFYMIGVIWYALLVRDFERRTGQTGRVIDDDQ
ncbi:MAG: MFS transporter [Bacteroidota bacterium]